MARIKKSPTKRKILDIWEDRKNNGKEFMVTYLDEETGKTHQGLWYPKRVIENWTNFDAEFEKYKKWRNKNEDVFVVKAVLKSRRSKKNGKKKYKLLWENGDTTWEPKKNLVNCKDVLNRYKQSKRTLSETGLPTRPANEDGRPGPSLSHNYDSFYVAVLLILALFI